MAPLAPSFDKDPDNSKDQNSTESSLSTWEESSDDEVTRLL
jgi:hypothetical protein